MSPAEREEVLTNISFPEYQFHIRYGSADGFYLSASYLEADTVTGKVELQRTRDWYLHPTAEPSQIVSTALLCVMTSMEHRVREWFHYKGKAIYMPHYDVEQLAALHHGGK